MRIELYSALDLQTLLEHHEWPGTFEAFLDSQIPQWREHESQRFAAHVDGARWPQERWGDTLPADAVVRLHLLPMGGIFKALGNILGKLFSFLGFGSRGRGGGNNETPEAKELNAASGKANTAKLGSVVPELAGTYKRFPDYLTPPRRYFVNKREQWLVFLACIGPGRYNVQPDAVRVGETPFTSLGEDAAYTIFEPGVDLSAMPAAQIWYTSPAVGSTSSGTAGLELTTEPANRDNTDPATYTFNTSTILRSSGDYPAGWGIGTVVAVEYPSAYNIVDFDDGGLDLRSRFTGYFQHLAPFATGTKVKVGTFGTTTEWTIAGIVASPGGGMFTLEFRDSGGAFVRVAPGTGVTYIFGADIPRTITAFNPTEIAVAPHGFQSPITKATRVRFVGGDVYGEWTNEFVATPDGSTTNLLELDTFFPQGLCYLDDDGTVISRSVAIEYQYRDSVGGPRTTLRYTYSDATVDQIGFTQQIPIATMVPRVRARRVGAQSTSTQIQDKCQWYGLKARLPDYWVYPNWTTMSVSLRSGGKLGQQSENQINVTATRILPTLQPDGSWGPPVATREISAFARYILQSAGVTDDQIDIEELVALNNIWNPRGETLDFVYDATTVKDALETAFGAGMAEFSAGDGLIRPVREDVRTPTAFEQSYSPHNMTRSLRQTISSHTEISDYDGVDVEFTSAITWAKETVQCRLPGDLGAKVQKITLEGVTDRTRAWRYGMRRRCEHKYRRKEYSFATELDALNSVYKGYVALFDSFKQTALMTGIRSDGAGGAIITCSEEFTWTPGATQIVGYRRLDGSFRGPWVATYGPGPNELRAAIPTPWPSVSLSHELPHVYFGTDTDFAFPALITGVTPRGQFDVNVAAVNYDARVYAYDNAFPPA